ncbi:hypothetical protein ABE10_01055, partial [Bacillus toyonensis]|nr:hypothetical protein [Bacillus toyonensis]
MVLLRRGVQIDRVAVGRLDQPGRGQLGRAEPVGEVVEEVPVPVCGAVVPLAVAGRERRPVRLIGRVVVQRRGRAVLDEHRRGAAAAVGVVEDAPGVPRGVPLEIASLQVDLHLAGGAVDLVEEPDEARVARGVVGAALAEGRVVAPLAWPG